MLLVAMNAKYAATPAITPSWQPCLPVDTGLAELQPSTPKHATVAVPVWRDSLEKNL